MPQPTFPITERILEMCHRCSRPVRISSGENSPACGPSPTYPGGAWRRHCPHNEHATPRPARTPRASPPSSECQARRRRLIRRRARLSRGAWRRRARQVGAVGARRGDGNRSRTCPPWASRTPHETSRRPAQGCGRESSLRGGTRPGLEAA